MWFFQELKVREAAAHVCVNRVTNAKTSTYTLYKVKLEDV